LKHHKWKPVDGVFQRGVGHYERKFQTEGGVAHQPPLVSENLSDWHIALSCGMKISTVHYAFVTKHACDGQNYDS